MNTFFKRTVQNTAVFLLLFIGIKNFIISMPLKYNHMFQGLYSRIDQKDTMFLQGRLAFTISVVMILLAYNLYKRLRSAWIGEILVLVVSIVLQAVYFHVFALHMIILESSVLIVLLLSFNDFSRMPGRTSVKKALLYILLSFVLMFINTTFSIYLIRGHMENLLTLRDAFIKSVQLIIYMDKSVLSIKNNLINIYADSLIGLYWFFIFSALIIILKPLAYDYLKNKSQKDRVLDLVMKYGQNPVAYLAMESSSLSAD